MKRQKVEKNGVVSWSFCSPASAIVLDLEMFGGFHTWPTKMVEVNRNCLLIILLLVLHEQYL